MEDSKTQLFKEKLLNKFPKIPYAVCGIYTDSHTHIIVKDKYGFYSIAPKHLMRGVLPGINSCLDKNNYCRIKAVEVYGNRNDYSQINYVNNSTLLSITCKVHNQLFFQTFSKHLRGEGCDKCASEKITLSVRNNYDFKSKFEERHPNKEYDYSLVVYTDAETPVDIICNKHLVVFPQKPKHHITKRGCPTCRYEKTAKHNQENPTGWSYTDWITSAEKSKNFDSFKVYIIKCWNEEEEFYKIGRTFVTTKKRFQDKYAMPYNYQVSLEVTSTANKILDLEKTLQHKYKDLDYKPNLNFNGMYECFNISLPIQEIIDSLKP